MSTAFGVKQAFLAILHLVSYSDTLNLRFTICKMEFCRHVGTFPSSSQEVEQLAGQLSIDILRSLR